MRADVEYANISNSCYGPSFGIASLGYGRWVLLGRMKGQKFEGPKGFQTTNINLNVRIYSLSAASENL